MAGALKYVFLAVAVFCYMQSAEMARLPRNTGNEPALPANIFESLTKPEFWNSLSANISSAFTEENLKKYGIKPDDVKDGLSKFQENVQSNVAEFGKNVNNFIEQSQQPAAEAGKPKKTKK